ncbi:MAG TPA: MMPL family transporter [Thermodesulfovibrionales bacterium]|nr:MMPL family transporter [Thermodesulfovibrionales bacterium]
MIGRAKDYPARLLTWWVATVQRHAFLVMVITIAVTGGILFHVLTHFSINVDTSSMLSEKLHCRQLEKEFCGALPNLSDTIVIVLDADTEERAQSARTQLAERLRKEMGLFKSVYEPGGGHFFERNGLLYLSVKELEDFADTLASAQPFLALLSQDLSVKGLFSMLTTALSRGDEISLKDLRIGLLFDGMSEAFESTLNNRKFHLSWQGMMFGKELARQRHQFIILRPYLDFTKLSSGEVPLETVRRVLKELGFNGENGVNAHITGDVALSHENLTEVRNSVGFATIVSLFLVSCSLYIGLGRSGRLVFASLTTLIIGLVWTTGFAVVFIGSLNLISITFAVLFIGLGIDYSIQFCLRYRELVVSGLDHGECIGMTAQGVGRSLLASCITIAIGFFSFVPTAYAGVAELGLISGMGMFISFFANLTILPALLTLLPLQRWNVRQASSGGALLILPYTHPKTVLSVAIILGLGALALFPRVYFDYNPLNLYDKKSEAIATVKDLFKDTDSSPWTISILVKGAGEAKALAEKLGSLHEVKMAMTISDFVPESQQEKLRILSDIRLMMPPTLKGLEVKHSSYEQELASLNTFEEALRKSLRSFSGQDARGARRLYEDIGRFQTMLKDPGNGQKAFAALEEGLLSGLPSLLERLGTLLQAGAVDMHSLPQDLVSQYVSVDGRYRVQVFPRENLLDRHALERFIHSVRTLAPDATDTPVTVYESGRAIASSFRQAALSALIVITLYLLVELRSISFTILILVPLLLAMLLTAASSALLDIPLNFANVIIVPLLLGVGVHSGLIFILRCRTEPPPDGNMLKTSTARAILFSTLTTIVSTSSLSFSAHRGIASMGMLLALCLSFMLVCTLILLPALLELLEKRNRAKSTHGWENA